jgi:hypothetical protein
MRKAAALFVLFLLAAPAAGQAPAAPSSEEGGEEISKPINLWPFVYEERGPERVELDILFSLIYYEKDRQKLSLGFRPFYSQLSDPEKKQREWSVLWQFAAYDRKEDVRKLHIFPLFWQKLSPPKSYSIFFPIYSYRRDEEKRKTGIIGYAPFSLFDFTKEYKTGRTSDRYLIVTYERQGQTTSFSVLPIYNQTHAPDRGEEQFFPLYHRAWDKPDGYSQFSMLGFPETWNLFETETSEKRESSKGHALITYWKTEPEERVRVFAPFYVRIESLDHDVTHVWPFYGYNLDDSDVERSFIWPFFRWSRDPVKDNSEVNLFWPLFQHRTSPEFKHDRFLPLYAWTRTTAKEPTSTLPLGLYPPLPLFYRQTGDGFSYNRFFWLAWMTRNGESEHDFVLNYYYVQSSSENYHTGLFPLWHRSRWPGHKLDLAPLYVYYANSDHEFRTVFPLWWEYRSPESSLKVGFPVYYDYRTSSSTFTTFFPLYYHSTDAAFGSELTYYFPFYGTYRRGETLKRHLLLFPLWSHLHDEATGLNAWDAVWPFFHYETAPDRSSIRVLPFYWSRQAPDGGFAIGFPIYWHFNSSESTQTHVVPLFGHYEKQDYRLNYVLGPLFIEQKDVGYHRLDLLGGLFSYRRSDEDTQSHFFPLYWAWNSPGYGQRLLFPLFGTERASPTYSSIYFLGFQPSYSLVEFTRDPSNDYSMTRFLNVYFRSDLGGHFGTVFPLYWNWGDRHQNNWMVLPLAAGHSDSATGAYDYAFLGLTGGLSLFGATRGSDYDSQRALIFYQRRTGDRHLRTVFPLFWQWWEPEVSDTYLFPLYSSTRDPDEHGWGLIGITPTWSLLSNTSEGGTSSSRLFPLYGVRSSTETTEVSVLGVWHGISLFHYEKSDHSVRHRFIPLYSYDRSGEDGAPGYEKHTSVLWRVVYYEHEGEETDFRFLFRLIRLHSEPQRSVTEVNPFYFKITRKDSSYWAVLGGLFGVETHPDGRRTYKFLWFL